MFEYQRVKANVPSLEIAVGPQIRCLSETVQLELEPPLRLKRFCSKVEETLLQSRLQEHKCHIAEILRQRYMHSPPATTEWCS